ncbi:glycosyltransferase [bacterium]|nr:MAG: glycosyltransferase [bacterium]
MSADTLISVLLTNYNTIDFIKLNLYALQKLTQNKYRVLINDNGSGKTDIAELERIAKNNDNVFVNFRKSGYNQASYAHAEALDMLIGMVDTKYTVVLDSDCVFLRRGWDDLLINELNDEVKIVGTPMPKGRGGNKPYDFPLQFAVLFDTKTYKDLNITCKPRDIANGEDTCWEWKPKFTGKGFKGKVFTANSTRDFKQGPFRDLICVEYYTSDNKLIASHFGRGSNDSTVKYNNKWFFRLPFVSRWVRKYFACREKTEWSSICRKIIGSEAAKARLQ